jgi:DNA-binding NtrC family response regulator
MTGSSREASVSLRRLMERETTDVAEAVYRHIISKKSTYHSLVRELELYCITQALASSLNNKALAAKRLGMKRTCLVEKMKKHKIPLLYTRSEGKITIPSSQEHSDGQVQPPQM